jgi:hypothetical protein
MTIERFRRFYNLRTSGALFVAGVTCGFMAYLLAPGTTSFVFVSVGSLFFVLSKLCADLRHSEPE